MNREKRDVTKFLPTVTQYYMGSINNNSSDDMVYSGHYIIHIHTSRALEIFVSFFLLLIQRWIQKRCGIQFSRKNISW